MDIATLYCSNEYYITKTGRIFRYIDDFELLPSLDHNGYNRIGIKGKKYSIHRLVYISFFGNIDKVLVIDHIDRNKLNNNLDNLRAVERSINSKNVEIKQRTFSKIICYNNSTNCKIIFNNTNEVSEYFNITIDKVWYLLKNNKEFNSWVFQRYNEIDNLDEYKQLGIVNNIDYGDKYLIDKNGDIIVCVNKNKDYRKLSKILNGEYYSINLNIDNKGKSLLLHRLVAKVFLENGHKNFNNKSLVVNHIDRNKTNNNYLNLEWISQQQNISHSVGRKVRQFDYMSNDTIKIFNSISEASRFIEVGPTSIRRAIDTNRPCKGFYFEFIDNNNNNNNINIRLCKRVNKLDVNTGEILETYKSIREAQRMLKIPYYGNRIKEAIENNNVYNGFRWKLAD